MRVRCATDSYPSDKQIDIDVFVQGNKAEAFGPNSHTETLALTQAVEGIGSSSISEALSAT